MRRSTLDGEIRQHGLFQNTPQKSVPAVELGELASIAAILDGPMLRIAAVNSANSVGHDIENGQLQVGLIRINAIYLMEMHVITARIFSLKCKRCLYPRQQNSFHFRTVDVELARTGRGNNKGDTIALTRLEDLHLRLFLSNIQAVGSILRANGELRSRKASGGKIYSSEEKRRHCNDSYPA